MNQIDLTSKNAVVTGGAQGIGRACVEGVLATGAVYDMSGGRATY